MRRWLFQCVVMLLSIVFTFPTVVYAQACTHYASSSGSGSTCTVGSPCLINSFWALASPGHVLCLNDGTYTGSNSMILPPSGVAGTSGNPITIRALNEGQVLLDAENSLSFAVNLSFSNGNDWFVIDGINAKRGVEAVYSASGANNILQRVIGWEGTSGAESYVFTITGQNSRAVDCAGWGMNVRKVFNGSQSGNLGTSGFKRCWGEWNDHPQGSSNPKNTLQVGYNSTNQLFENMVMTWDTLGDVGIDAEGVIGVMKTNSVGVANDIEGTRVLGTIAYVRPGSTYSAPTVLLSANTTGMTITDSVFFVAPGYSSIYPMYLLGCTSPTCSSNVCTNCLAVHAGTASVNDSESGWTLPSLHQGNGLAAATGGTSAFTLLPGICTRYEGGTLTGTPLWPWPMEDRIAAARAAGGFRTTNVTAEVESILGTIPSECIAGSDTTAPTVSVTAPIDLAFVSDSISVTANASDDVGVVGVQFKLDGSNLGSEDTTSTYGITWDTTTATNGRHVISAVARDAAGNTTTAANINVTIVNNPTGVSITANSTITFLSEPTSVSVSAGTVPPALENPSGVSISAAGTPTFLSDPSSTSISASGTPTFLSNPSGVSIIIP